MKRAAWEGCELRMSPPSVEVWVEADGSTDVDLYVWPRYHDTVEIQGRDIPLQVEPAAATVVEEEWNKVTVTLHGDINLPTETYKGRLLFLLRCAGGPGVGIEIRTTIHHVGVNGENGENGENDEEPVSPGPHPAMLGGAAVALLGIVFLAVMTSNRS